MKRYHKYHHIVCLWIYMTLDQTHVFNTVYLDQAYMVIRALNPLHQHLNPFTATHIVSLPSCATVSHIRFQFLHSKTGHYRYSTPFAGILLFWLSSDPTSPVMSLPCRILAMRADLLSVIELRKPTEHWNGTQKWLLVAQAGEDPCQKFRYVASF